MGSLLKFLYSKRECLLLFIIFVAVGICYCTNLTTSGLWYDEAIEYFYSKHIVGDIPLPDKFDNMYDRICSTYQPPLYNFLMYFWLQMHDSEAFFRLSGVFFTFVGSIGFYLGLRKIVSYRWASIGLCLYLSTSCVVSYTLECAEYNLLLAMECWMLYFFVNCTLQGKSRRWKYIIGFYLFASLSFYSQYGAAFLIAAMFISIFIQYVRDKDYHSIKWLIGMGVVTLLLAILPLWIWFLRIQMDNQQSLSVDHRPIFVNNNIIYSIVLSLYYTFIFLFGLSLPKLIVIVFSLICTLYAVTRSRRTPLLDIFIFTSGVSWLSFFAASACSYYAYNPWDGRMGCYNIIVESRYTLFIVPLFVTTFVLGLHSFYHTINTNKYLHNGILVFVILLPFIMYLSMWENGIGIKNDIREVTYTWIKKQGYNYPTLVQEWAAGTFHFYFRHSTVYNIQTEANIITPDTRFRTKDNNFLRKYLQELNAFSNEELYYISNKFGINGASSEQVRDIFVQEGYKVDTVGIEASSILLFLKKRR